MRFSIPWRAVRPLLAASLVAGCGLAPVLRAAAAEYPQQPVRMVVGFAAGGPSDILARIVAKGLSQSLGQSVVVDNKAGAGGVLGTREAAHAKPDGYTILFAGDATLTVLPQLTQGVGYDAIKDFTPLRVVASQSNVLVVHQSLQVKDLAGLIAKAKAQPDAVSYGSAGNGSPSHLIGALFAQRAGVQLLHVPYKGAGPAMTDLIGGQLNSLFVGMPVAQQNATRKETVMLAVTGDKRSPALPKVPTFKELGIQGMGSETAVWWSLMAPAGLPENARKRLDAAIKAALNDPEVRQGLVRQGVDVLNLDSSVTTQWIRRDQDKWTQLIRDQHLSAQ